MSYHITEYDILKENIIKNDLIGIQNLEGFLSPSCSTILS